MTSSLKYMRGIDEEYRVFSEEGLAEESVETVFSRFVFSMSLVTNCWRCCIMLTIFFSNCVRELRRNDDLYGTSSVATIYLDRCSHPAKIPHFVKIASKCAWLG